MFNVSNKISVTNTQQDESMSGHVRTEKGESEIPCQVHWTVFNKECSNRECKFKVLLWLFPAQNGI